MTKSIFRHTEWPHKILSHFEPPCEKRTLNNGQKESTEFIIKFKSNFKKIVNVHTDKKDELKQSEPRNVQVSFSSYVLVADETKGEIAINDHGACLSIDQWNAYLKEAVRRNLGT